MSGVGQESWLLQSTCMPSIHGLLDITAALQKLVLSLFRVVLMLILNVLPHRLVNSAVGCQGQDRRSCP